MLQDRERGLANWLRAECTEGEGRGDRLVIDTDEREEKRTESNSDEDRKLNKSKERGG